MPSDDVTKLNAAIDELRKLIEGIDRKLDKSMSKVEKAIKEEVASCKLNLVKLTVQVNDLERSSDDMFETQSRLLNLRIDNVPERESENLNAIVETLKSTVGMKVGEPRTYQYRLKKGPSKGTIIVRFNNLNDKEAFFRNYLKVAKTLSSKKVVPSAKKDERIFVSHDLCLSQYKLNRYALKKKAEGAIHATRINHGFVSVQLSEKGFFQRILSIRMLDDALKGTSSQQTT